MTAGYEDGAPLGDVVELLDDLSVRWLTDPSARTRRVTNMVAYHISETPIIAPGDAVCAVGLTPEVMVRTDALGAIRRYGAAAVIVKVGDDVPKSLVEAAVAQDLALLAIPQSTEWGRLITRGVALLEHQRSRPPALPLDHDLGDNPMGALFDLADAIAERLGGAVTIEDARHNLLAYSGTDGGPDGDWLRTIVARRTLPSWRARVNEPLTSRRLRHQGEVVAFPAEGSSSRRLAVAVRAGKEVLGSIWVLDSGSLRTDAEEQLRELATTAVVHMVRHRSSTNDFGRFQEEVLLRALEGCDAGGEAALKLGFTEGSEVALAAVRLRSDARHDASVATTLYRIEAQRLLSKQCAVNFGVTATASLDDAVYALVPVSAGVERVRQALAQVLQLLPAWRDDVVVGISSAAVVTPRLDGIVQLREEADRVTAVLDCEQGSRVASYDQVLPQALLAEHRRLIRSSPFLLAGKLPLLLEHDRTHGTQYIETLEVYLAKFGNIKNAAAELTIHQNTLRYRMHQILELSGIDLEDPTERLITALQIDSITHPGGAGARACPDASEMTGARP